MHPKFPGLLLLAALAAAAPARAADTADALTWNGLTLYGIVDIGYAHQSYGAPRNDVYAQGLEYGISANSSRSINAWSPNGLSQSRLGLRGNEPLAADLVAVFTLETRFNPLSGDVANGAKSLTQNNGVPLAAQNTNGDSSQAGQIFGAAAFAGLSSAIWGTLTYGRQNGLLYDNVLKYDAQGGAYAFSLIGFSAVTAGGGVSEYNRLNNSLKYVGQFGPLRAGAQYQWPAAETGGRAYQFDLGTDIGRVSVDAVYANKKNAYALSTWSPTAAQLQASGLALGNAVKSTLSDNSSWAAMARVELGALKLYGGYERMTLRNPGGAAPDLAVGAATIGGYAIGALVTDAYDRAKVLQVGWAGVRYALTPDLDLVGAAYAYRQNSYATGRSAGCADTSASACAGTERAYSLLADYRLNRYVDVYAGAMRSGVAGGLASGFLHTATTTVMTGGRLSF